MNRSPRIFDFCAPLLLAALTLGLIMIFPWPMPEANARDQGSAYTEPEPQLSTRLHDRNGGGKTEMRLQAYAKNPDTLVGELTGKLAELSALDPLVREESLRAFAETQASRLLALEQEAERIRAEATDPRATETAELPAQSLADAVYEAAVLEPGLSPPQRRLLFNAGLGKLRLSIPRAELMPTGPFPIPSSQ